jgi:PAS domain S-box-containing protein
MNEPVMDNPKRKVATLHWYHWIVVMLSLILTISAWYITSQQEIKKSQSRFDYQSLQILELVKERMSKYEDTLWSGIAHLHALSAPINTHSWARFSKALSIAQVYPGINGIGIIDYVTQKNLSDYLSAQRVFRPNYKIHPPHNNNEYWPITHIEPLASNKKAVGLDMAHETNRWTASKRARDTGKAHITGPITLVQDAKKTPGFLLFIPFYSDISIPQTLSSRQETFKGMVYAPFVMANLMEGTLKNTNRLVNFSIADGDTLLYNEFNVSSDNLDSNPVFSTQKFIEIYGRIWKFNIKSTTLFRSYISSKQSSLILICGIIIDCMLLAFFILLTRSKDSAIKLAKNMAYEFKASEHHLQTPINSMYDGLISIDHQGLLLSANQSALKILGYSDKDFIGKEFKSVLKLIKNKYQNKEYLDLTDKDILNKKMSFDIINNKNRELPIEITVNKITDDNKGYFIVTLRDLSLKIKTERALNISKATLEAAADASASGFVIMDNESYIIESNKAMCDWLGYSEGDLIGTHFLGLIAIEDKNAFNIEINNLLNLNKKSTKIEVQYLHKTKGLKWGLFSATAAQSVNGQVTYIVAHIVDIQKERSLLKTLTQQNIALERSNADLEQFAYIASHDLKAPLNAIQQIASWIEEDCQDIIPDASKEHLQLLMARTKRMTLLLEDLLNYARVSNYEYDSEDINLNTLVTSQFSLQSGTEKFSLECPDSQLKVPRIPLEIVIRNILSNTIKHHDKDEGSIKIELILNVDFYQIKITDDGPGIPPKMQSKVLEMFQTLKPRDDVEGSGMGLAMVNRITTHYSGSVYIESDGVRGTSFSINWPFNVNKNTPK